jgi:hypothetical protein
MVRVGSTVGARDGRVPARRNVAPTVRGSDIVMDFGFPAPVNAPLKPEKE